MKLFFLTTFVFAVTYNTYTQCETAPMEGYRGNCTLSAVVSIDGMYVYSSNGDGIKKWNFANKNVEAEWPVENKVKELYGVSNDGRYITYRNGNGSFNLFDTGKGSKVVIDGNEILAMLPKQNIAVLSELKSRTAQMIKSYYTKAISYDLKTGKKKTLGEFRSFKISESGARIALQNGDKVSVFDLVTGKMIYNVTLNDFHKTHGLSDNGKYFAWQAGVVDLDNPKNIIPIKTPLDNDGGLYLFSPDVKSLYFLQKTMFNQGGWRYGFPKVQKYDVQSGKLENDFSANWASSIREIPNGYAVFPAANNQLYIFDGKTVALTSEESFQNKSDVLDLFGNIGSGGQAQIAKEEEEKAHMAALREKMIPKFQALRETEYFHFPSNNHLHLFDYNSETGLALIGDVFQSGLFKMPEGTLIKGFGPNPTSMRLGPYSKQVKTGINTVSGAISPNGDLVAFGGDGVSELYRNGTFVKRYNDIAFIKILDDRLAITNVIGEEKLVLYDFENDKVIVNYGKGGWQCKLSPDKTKLMRDSKVQDVKTGKVLFETKQSLSGITNNYVVIYDVQKLRLIELATGNEVQPQGWDDKKRGTMFVSGGHVVTYTANGPMYAYDIENKKYVSSKPVLKLGTNVFEERAYFSGTSDVFILNNQGFAAYFIEGVKTESASAYCMNAKSGEINPYLFHQPKQVVQEANKRQQEANQPTPEVTALLSTLRDLPAGYKFNYTDFDYMNLNNNSVATRYFTNLGGDKIYVLGRVCSGFGTTKVLALIHKNMGTSEQYIFHLLHVGPKGIVKNDILGATQKVNGTVTELANLEILSGSKINITTESNSGIRTKSFNCN